MKKKSHWLMGLFFSLLLVFIAGCGNTSNAVSEEKKKNTDKVIEIGYQKFGTLNFLKAQKSLEKKLEPKGYKVKWTEFPGGPQLLEALNVGSLDFGHTGEAPPIFAQAAKAPLVYVGNEPPNPKGEAILVPKGSTIKSVKDLKGKKIALNKGSNVHYLLVKALEKAGVQYKDIQPAFLPPADARAAFEKGEVDAWVIWDPFLAEAQRTTGAKILQDGTDLVNNREFFLASDQFAKDHKDIVNIILKEVQSAEKWVSGNKKEAAKFLAPQLGMDEKTLELVLQRRTYGLEKINQKVVGDQQDIADQFLDLKLIPNEIKVKDALPQQ
ncbi:sulfonate ABC transporter substrate-binding protein [Fictibacillus sp. S7]|uniref:sulfonate ABC transporter substrate-binding protein n=1 Tax=Fictibacillus sp. S7 TaxID=2212476 RepID=UPI001F523EBC|nr:sulfonate ABC transporter substrate-binding protein [Fictibacillus sp. S7]